MLPSYTATVTPGPELHQRTAWLNLRVWAPLLGPTPVSSTLEQHGRTASSVAPTKLQILES